MSLGLASRVCSRVCSSSVISTAAGSGGCGIGAASDGRERKTAAIVTPVMMVDLRKDIGLGLGLGGFGMKLGDWKDDLIGGSDEKVVNLGKLMDFEMGRRWLWWLVRVGGGWWRR